MAYAAIPISVLNGILINIPIAWTTRVIDGQCFAYAIWQNASDSVTYISVLIMWQYVIPLSMFVYCYGRILIKIKQSARTLNGPSQSTTVSHGSHPSSNNSSSNRSQMNVIRTMIIISSAYAVCWCPNMAWFALTTFSAIGQSDEFNYISVFLLFFNVCLDPFIYTASHAFVRKNIKARFGCKNRVNIVIQVTTTNTT